MPGNKSNNKSSRAPRKAAPRRSNANLTKPKQPSRGPKMTYSEAKSIVSTRGVSFSASSGNGLTVRGKEVFRDLTTSQFFKPFTFTINPSNLLIFPKLQAMGILFEEFFVRSLKVRYMPACPTTRSGSVAMCFDYDSLDSVPKSILELMANSSSVVGSVGENLSLDFTPSAQRAKWYYTSGISNSASDIRQIAPANLHIIMLNSTSSDAGLVAGYLEVEYIFDFKEMRPPPEAFAQTTSQQAIGTSVPSGSNFVNLLLENAIGYNGLTGSANTVGNPGSYPLNQTNSLLLSAGTYALSWLFGLGGTSSSTEEKNFIVVEEMKEPKVRKRRDSLETEEKKVLKKESKSDSPGYIAIKQNPDGSWLGELPDGEWVQIPPAVPPSELKVPQATGDYAVYIPIVDMEDGTAINADYISGNSSSAVSGKGVLEVTISRPSALAIQTVNANARNLTSCMLGVSRITQSE